MGQQQIRVSFSLGTKLLLSLVLLLIVCIAFLSVSTVLLYSEDKEAYIKQAQSNESLLLGRELVSGSQHVIDFLRQSLGAVNVFKPMEPAVQSGFQLLLDNQSTVASAAVSVFDPKSKVLVSVAQALKAGAESPPSPKDAILARMAEFEKNSYLLFPSTNEKGQSRIGVVIADFRNKNEAGVFAVASATIPLDSLAGEFNNSNLMVVTHEGWILFGGPQGGMRLEKHALFEAASKPNSLAQGTLEFGSEKGRFIGSYTKPGLGLLILSQVSRDRVMRAVYTLAEKFVYLGLSTVGLAMIFAIFFSKTITAPINQLYEATKKVAAGDFNVTLKQKGGDEISALTASFIVMSQKITALIADNVKKVQLENELKIASTVQQTLIPADKLVTERVEVQAHYQSAAECGGDWWGYIESEDRMFFMIADATGHGLPSALITAAAHSCFSVLTKLVEENGPAEFSPASFLKYANRAIFDSSASEIMMTFFVAMIDFKANALTFANAGHQAGWIFKKDVVGSQGLVSLSLPGHRLGESKDADAYEERTVPYHSGDTLFLYTDGLIDASNDKNDFYGKKRVRVLVDKHVKAGPASIVSNLVADVASYIGTKPLDDDLTMVVVRRT